MTQWEKSEFYILLVTVIIGGIISVLDLVGTLDNVIWLKDRVPTVTLLLVTLIAGSLYIGAYNTREFLKSVLPTGTVTRFDSYEENLRYVLRRVRQAKRSVFDVTWLPHLKPGVMIGVFASTEDREGYLRTVEHISKKVPYREIMMFCGSANRVDKARRLIEQAGEYYKLAVYPDLPAHAPPRWQFLIIDEEEVLLPEWRLAIVNFRPIRGQAFSAMKGQKEMTLARFQVQNEMTIVGIKPRSRWSCPPFSGPNRGPGSCGR